MRAQKSSRPTGGRLPESRNLSAAYCLMSVMNRLSAGPASFLRPDRRPRRLRCRRAGACGRNHATAGCGADVVDGAAGLHDGSCAHRRGSGRTWPDCRRGTDFRRSEAELPAARESGRSKWSWHRTARRRRRSTCRTPEPEGWWCRSGTWDRRGLRRPAPAPPDRLSRHRSGRSRDFQSGVTTGAWVPLIGCPVVAPVASGATPGDLGPHGRPAAGHAVGLTGGEARILGHGLARRHQWREPVRQHHGTAYSSLEIPRLGGDTIAIRQPLTLSTEVLDGWFREISRKTDSDHTLVFTVDNVIIPAAAPHGGSAVPSAAFPGHRHRNRGRDRGRAGTS